MAKPFSVETEESRFRLPLQTRRQIKALATDLDQDARSVVIIAIAELWQREIGEPDRDLAAEIDAIKAQLGMQ
jgi:hypothetical protein